MSRYLSMVNQKLLFARLLLEDIDQTGVNPYRHQAVLESVVFQLRLAYHFHLQEIAANYQCPQPGQVNVVAELSQQLRALNKWPAEAQEMQSLLDTDGSWLAQLLTSHDNCFLAGDTRTPETADPAPQFISLTRLDDGSAAIELTAESVRNWLSSLVEMIDRHREGMFEC